VTLGKAVGMVVGLGLGAGDSVGAFAVVGKSDGNRLGKTLPDGN